MENLYYSISSPSLLSIYPRTFALLHYPHWYHHPFHHMACQFHAHPRLIQSWTLSSSLSLPKFILTAAAFPIKIRGTPSPINPKPTKVMTLNLQSKALIFQLLLPCVTFTRAPSLNELSLGIITSYCTCLLM